MDKLLTGRYTAFPVFLLAMMFIFVMTFNWLGKWMSDGLSLLLDWVTNAASAGLTAYGINPVVHSMIIDGVFAGVGGVLSFLPVIVTLFFFLSILEDTGYMARVAFVMDKPLRRLGMSGRSFVPMLIGFGCTVPAVMASRTLASQRDRRMTIMLTPFMSCSAKITIYSVFCAAFFPKHAALVMMGLYVGGIVVGIGVAWLLKKSIFRGEPAPFVMELPDYRLPSVKNVGLLLWDKAKDFLKRAFTIIFIATVVVWFLRTFDAKINVAADPSVSLLAMLGQLVSPIFHPLGFADWRVATALMTGFTAKEAVVSTLSVLLNTGMADLSSALSALFTVRSAISFLLFTLLYTPCVAAIASIKRELHSTWGAVGTIVMQCVTAWIVAALAFLVGGLFL